MAYSSIIALVWVFFVSIWARGWATKPHITAFIFWLGIAFIVVRLLEWLGVLTGSVSNPRDRG